MEKKLTSRVFTNSLKIHPRVSGESFALKSFICYVILRSVMSVTFIYGTARQTELLNACVCEICVYDV
jgi:hypothetical protein